MSTKPPPVEVAIGDILFRHSGSPHDDMFANAGFADHLVVGVDVDGKAVVADNMYANVFTMSTKTVIVSPVWVKVGTASSFRRWAGGDPAHIRDRVNDEKGRLYDVLGTVGELHLVHARIYYERGHIRGPEVILSHPERFVLVNSIESEGVLTLDQFRAEAGFDPVNPERES